MSLKKEMGQHKHSRESAYIKFWFAPQKICVKHIFRKMVTNNSDRLRLDCEIKYKFVQHEIHI